MLQPGSPSQARTMLPRRSAAPEPSRRPGILFGNPERVLGAALLSIGAGLLISQALSRNCDEQRKPNREPVASPPVPGRGRRKALGNAARLLFSSSAVLSFSGVADSGLEHYRGKYTNPAMFIAPTISLLTLAVSSRQAAKSDGELRGTSRAVYGISAATGIAGLGFHLYNVGKRVGRFSWLNLFYGAPLLAPGTLLAAGVAGLSGNRIEGFLNGERTALPSARLLAIGTTGAMAATAAEAALLHFRGAFQNPYMFLPTTVPPLAALMLAVAALNPTRGILATSRVTAGATAALGLLGTVFHAYGIHRNMGGWRNWSQTILQGPPLPAPPGFTGVALAALAAVTLLEEHK